VAAIRNATGFTYDPNGNPATRSHDDEFAEYQYDTRDLVERATNGESASDPTPKVTRFTYTPRGQQLRQTKANSNTVDSTYFLDGLLKTQVEKKANGTLVSSHTLAYDPNGHRTSDAAKRMNADNHAAYLDHVYAYSYDPRDRIRQVTKSAAGGGVLETESYTHDANNNVITQTVEGATTNFTDDRNRLLSATTGTTTATYNYDPFGRLDKVTAGTTVLERYLYDGFDRVSEHRKANGQGGTDTTRYAYDPLDRTTSRTEKAGAPGEKRTDFNYLGLSGEVLSEEIAGQVQKSYQYSPWGQRLSQVKFTPGGGTEDSFYGYNPHSDVETLTNQSGDTRATYGYTAYGRDDKESFTGIDKPDPQNPTAEPYNVYRFNAKRFDPASGDYDMGFRDYDPGLNRFLSRDSYNGALADLNLGLSPWTMNRYGFAGGNPVSFIELDGHIGGLPDEDLRELRKAGYTYVMGKGVVPLPGGASGGSSQSGFTPEEERARAAWMYGAMGPGLGANDPRYCYMHSVGGVSECQALDAAATAAAGLNQVLGPIAELSGGPDLERCFERHISSCGVSALTFLPIGKVGKGAEAARAAAAGALKYSGRHFPDYEEGSHLVYVLMREGSPVRVGISQPGDTFAKRMSDEARQYRGRFDRYHVLVSGLTKTQARAVETHLLQNYKTYLPLNEADRSMTLPAYRKLIPWVESVINDWFSFG
jgi:RHS repeat-associated protein